MRRYIKLETMWDASGWLDILSAEAQLCWVKLLCYVKGHGWDGKVKAISPLTASRMWNVGEESVRQLLKAAELHGAIKNENQEWVVVKWDEYQGDPKAAERQARFKEKHKNVSNALPPVSNADTIQIKDTINPPLVPPGDFDSFWKIYPRRQGSNPKAQAKVAYEKAIRGGAHPDEIYNGARQYAASLGDDAGTKFVAQAVTWLNQKRWADEYAVPETPWEGGIEEQKRRALAYIERKREEGDADFV